MNGETLKFQNTISASQMFCHCTGKENGNESSEEVLMHTLAKFVPSRLLSA